MYKVKPEDVIPTRTEQEIKAITDSGEQLVGGIWNSKNKNKAEKVAKKLQYLFNNIGTLGNKFLPQLVSTAHKAIDLQNLNSVKNSVCAVGCSHCCKVNVELSQAEAAYISFKTGFKIIERAYNRPPSDKNRDYCPFHNEKTATCGIYKYRPVMCRGFFAFDSPGECEDGQNSHAITAISNIPYTNEISLTLNHITQTKPKDIRYWFGEKNLIN